MKIKNEHKYYINGDGEKILVSVRERDENENLLKETHYNDNGALESETVYRYDEKNNLVSETTQGHEEFDKTIIEYQYDDNGKLKQRRNMYSDGTFDHDDYSHKENSSECKSYNYDGELLGSVEIMYEKNRLTKTEKKDAEGNTIEITTVSYHENGLESGKRTENLAEGYVLVEQTEFDSEGHPVKDTEEIVMREDDELASRTVTFYSGGKIKERIHEDFFHPGQNRKYIFLYSETGLLTEYRIAGSMEEHLATFTYQHNSYGNLSGERQVYSATYINHYGAGLSPLQQFEYEYEYFN